MLLLLPSFESGCDYVLDRAQIYRFWPLGTRVEAKHPMHQRTWMQLPQR